MKITIISDTHCLHDAIKVDAGTVLIHAGDITEFGTEEEIIDFLNWFSRQPFTYKIFIAGNHDLFLQECSIAKINRLVPKGIVYLQNSGIEIENVRIWGSPVTPYFMGMAFNVRAGKDIERVWNKIPLRTNILITHGPPLGVLDNGIGCEALWSRVKIIKPLIHCFGHAHGQNGIQTIDGTTFINAALVNVLDPLKNELYKVTGKPLYMEI